MTKVHCSIRLEIDIAHRVVGHQGKCKNLHGHRYAIEVTCSADQLDDMGMVIDFGIIKQKLRAWLETYWDHNVVLYDQDQQLGDYIQQITGQEIFYVNANPTAENLALYIYNQVCPALFSEYNIIIEKIRLYETPNCYAEVIR